MGVQVWLGDQPAGDLDARGSIGEPAARSRARDRQDGTDLRTQARAWRLRYAPEWLNQWRAYPLSPRLPLNAAMRHGLNAQAPLGVSRQHLKSAHAPSDTQDASGELAVYLRLLLPGGLAEQGLAQALGLGVGLGPGLADEDSQDGLGQAPGFRTEHAVTLLSAVGDDLPGAVSLRDARAGRAARRRGLPLRVLPFEEMAQRLQEPPAKWLMLEPGADPDPLQPVLPWWPSPASEPLIGVYLDQERWWWTRTPQLASTHLIEAPMPGEVDEVGARRLLNKLFCLRLAARLGLDVAPVELRRLPMPVLQFQRWDRQRLDDGRVHRLHAVSVAQVFGVPCRVQASVAAAGALVADGLSAPPPLWLLLGGLPALSPQPLVERRALIRWWIFQALIGNWAASPMDLWCYLDPTGLRLAPVMNLWCPLAESERGLTGSAVTARATGAARAAVARGATGVAGASGATGAPGAPGAIAAVGAGAGAGADAGAGAEWATSMVPVCTQASDWALVAKSCGATPRSLANELRRLCEAAPQEAQALAIQLRDSIPEPLLRTLVDVVTAGAATHLEWVEDLLHTDHRD